MTDQMQQWLIIILGAVALTAVIGWILTYLRLRGTYFVVGEDSLKITYFFLNERLHPELDTMTDQELKENMASLLSQKDLETVEFTHLITGEDVMVNEEDTFLSYAKRGPEPHSIKPPPMRFIAIRIELIRGGKR